MTCLTAHVTFDLSKKVEVSAHGRLMDPPARNSMWRFGFPNPVNYNDNELYCGGYAVQWHQNEGKCGSCGDAYHLPRPRPHEAGGEFAKGTITRHYQVGQDIDVEVELTSNHQGYFEMFICPNNNPASDPSDACFEKYNLYLTGTNETRFIIPDDSEKKAIFHYKVSLPPYLTCSQCIIQWNYITANMWGTCENGTEAVGCGQSETFRNCADVSIITSAAGLPPIFVQQDNPFLLYYRDQRTPNIHPLIIRSQVCQPNERYSRIPGMDLWCQTNCLRYPPNCPTSICGCPEICEPIGDIAGKEGAAEYCLDRCLVYPSKCPKSRCRCY
ncbi:unnamed protein product [Trichogramma brassicae]|uniref:Chitin-binding type-4 domain-containing protein n=1 Tax=Trichogramma brassicae TaxID=86971 RepID=A0A6H5IW09_9HYME|nr:unnamed protein product [Trichogramma brassicae]